MGVIFDPKIFDARIFQVSPCLGTLAATESGDVAAINGGIVGSGILAATEAPDTAAINGGIVATGSLAATEAADQFAGTGEIAGADIVGALAASEGADVAAFAGQAEQPIIVVLPGGGYRPPLHPPLITGVGFGILPALEGDAHGVVIAAGTAAAMLRLAGDANVTVSVIGYGVARLTSINAAALGDISTRGSGAGVIGGLEGRAVGRHDDDEAAIIAWLLAA